MKKILLIIFLTINCNFRLNSQNYLDYLFVPTEFGYYNEITGGVVSTASGDDGAQNIDLPFPFSYMGETYSTARISVNGWLEMGQTYTGTGFLNELESTIKKPLICPLWDDLIKDSQSEIRYQTIGEYPARIFIVQWKNLLFKDSFIDRMSFQIRLWEIDGTIDFVYGPKNLVVNFASYSVGLNNHIGGSDNFISITPVSQYNYSVSTTVANNNINDLSILEEGLMLSFVPVSSSQRKAILYQTPDSVVVGNPNQKILAIIVTCHFGGVLTPPWVTKFNFNTNGTSNTNDIQNAKVFYTGSSPYFSTQHQLGATYPNPAGLFSIGGFSRYLINNGVTYFWLAFDIAPNATIGNFVDGSCYLINFEGCCPSLIPDSSLASSNCIIVQSTLPSILTIGSSGYYDNLSDAFQELQSHTIVSSHILELLPSYDPASETYPIVIPFINGSSQSNSITIRPASNVSNINLSSDTTILIFHNSTYITIDGRPGSVGGENELSFTNNSIHSSTILFYNGANFDSLKYCKIYGADSRLNGAIVLFDGTTYTNSNNTLYHCLITNSDNNLPANAIKIFNTYSGAGSHHRIEKCEIKNFTRSGIEVYTADHTYLSGNNIHNEYPVNSQILYGINNYGKYITINGCSIYNLNSNSTEANEIYGINIPRAYSGTVYNNFISLSGNEFSGVTGIYLFGELFFSDYYFYFNTIHIYGTNTNASNSYCFNTLYGLSENLMYRQWHLKNNIFINNKTNSSGTGTHLAIAVHDPYFVGNSDFNNFYVDSSNSYLALWLNSYVNDIEEWRSLSNRDFNSVSTSVSFVSDIDLHLSGNSLGDTLLIATPLPLINKDIDDEIRNLQFPYKGADENLEYPLPVELLTFSASLLNGNVNLTWISTSETNNQGFEILRFAQDDIDWSKIGFVEGRGTTTEPQFYSFTDESLQPGKYQYRLKQIDFDGSFEYSKVVEVTVQEPTKFSLSQNYPNPFNPTTKIKYEIPNVETRHASSLQFIALKVYDILGNEVASLVNEEKQPGFYEVEFNAKELSSGIYYYQLNTGTFIQTKKMILLK